MNKPVDMALGERWKQLAKIASLVDAETLGIELLGRWREPHRRYHDAAHLAQVLDVLDLLEAGPALQLAAWFHDAIYSPHRRDNELRSAALARLRLRRAGLARNALELVVHAVLATATHHAVDTAIAPLIDADLAIFGADPATYKRYADAIRDEYAFVPDESFRSARAVFLRVMLDRPSVFLTPIARARFEFQARQNLREELATLT